jgi:hypothetical protein
MFFFFCQTENRKNLCNPKQSVKLRGSEDGLEACFREILKNITLLHELDRLPAYMILNDVLPSKGHLISSGGDAASENSTESIIDLMKRNDVVWHSICKANVNAQKVERLKRFRCSESNEYESSQPITKKTRSTFGEDRAYTRTRVLLLRQNSA